MEDGGAVGLWMERKESYTKKEWEINKMKH